MSKVFVIGLDVSTSIVGVTICDENENILYMGNINFSKCTGLWEKADFFKDSFIKIYTSYIHDSINKDPDTKVYCVIEEAFSKFASGRSTAHTIGILTQFNGIVSYICQLFLKERGHKDSLQYINVTHARKLCGIKILRKHPRKLNAKLQVFEYMMEHDLKDRVSEMKTKKVRGESTLVYPTCAYDMVDSYVIAKAFCRDLKTKNTL